MRQILRAQGADQPWTDAQRRLRVAYATFTRNFGPINLTTITTQTDAETGEIRETHRRPNLSPFLDDPDCWLVSSIEEYDLESGIARHGAIFTERVIAPPAPAVIFAVERYGKIESRDKKSRPLGAEDFNLNVSLSPNR